MRFRKVGPEVLDGPGGTSRGTPSGSDRSPIGTHGRNRATTVEFAKAWMAHDWDRVRQLAGPELTCRWTGFGQDGVTARTLEEAIAFTPGFEARHGTAARYRVVEAMGGEHHAAILFEPADLGVDVDHVARVAVYRIEDGRVVGISVYADRRD
jgi:hypothetical protein